MDILLPIFKKDLLRLRWMLICWIALLCVQLFLGISGAELAVNNHDLGEELYQIVGILNFLQALIVVVMIPLLIQAEPLVGTTAFWFTRPIGRRQLLFTKLGFTAALLVFVPLLAEWIIFAINGFSTKYILLSSPEIIVSQLLSLIPVLLLAAITPKFSRFAVIGIGVVVFLIVASIIGAVLDSFIPTFKNAHVYFQDKKEPRSETLTLSAGIICCVVAVAWGYAVLAYQYLCRRTIKTVFLIIIGLVLLVPIYFLWSADFLKKELKTETAINKEMVTFKIKNIGARDGRVYDYDEGKKKEKEIEITAKYTLSCSSPNEYVVLKKWEPLIEYPENVKLESLYFSQWCRNTMNKTEQMKYIQTALTASRIVNPYVDSDDDYDYQRDPRIQLFRCSEDLFARYQGKPGIYKANLELDCYKYKISSVLPLKRHAVDNLGSEQIVISSISHIDNGINVVVIEKKAKMILDPSNGDFNYDRFADSCYLLQNEKRGEAFVANPENEGYYSNVFDVTDRLRNEVVRLKFLYVNKRNSQLPKIDQEWLKDAQLVRVDTVLTGHLTKQLEIKDFVLPEKSANSDDE